MIVLWHCSTYYLVEHCPQYCVYRDDKIACYKAIIIITIDHWERMRCCQFVLIVWYKINKHLKMVWKRCVRACVCACSCVGVYVLMCMCVTSWTVVVLLRYVCDCIVDTVSNNAINSVYGIDKVVCVQLTTYSMTNSWKDS